MSPEMSSAERATALAIIGAVFVLTLLDVTISVMGWTGGTISEVLLRAARHYPVVAFVLSMLLAHVFLGGSQQLRPVQDWMGSDVGLLATILAGLLVGALVWKNT